MFNDYNVSIMGIVKEKNKFHLSFIDLSLPQSWWLTLALSRHLINIFATTSSSHSEMFLGKGVLKVSSKFTGEHSCRSVISIKLQSNFTEITLRHGCSPINLLHIFRTPFPKNTSWWLLLRYCILVFLNHLRPPFPLYSPKTIR